MAELFGVSKQFIGMTATLINGYVQGIFLPGTIGAHNMLPHSRQTRFCLCSR